MAIYYRPSILRKIIAFLIAIPVIAFLAHLVYQWLIPWLPIAGALLLLVFFSWFALKRR
jgi:hypothetical protein